jgi:hypothetical protein
MTRPVEASYTPEELAELQELDDLAAEYGSRSERQADFIAMHRGEV